MEIKGIGQDVPIKPVPEPLQNYQFEETFDESKKTLVQFNKNLKTITNPTEEMQSELDLDMLKSPTIDNNPQFITLKKWLANYNKELHDKSDSEKDLGHHRLKRILFGCLIKLLHQIVLTKDRGMQISYLQRVHDWFARRNRDQKSLISQNSALNKYETPQKRATVYDYSENKFLYTQKSRTFYPELQSTKKRLEEYRLKSIQKPEILEKSPTSSAKTAVSNGFRNNFQITDFNSAIRLNPEPENESNPKYQSESKLKKSEFTRNKFPQVPIEVRSNFIYYKPKGSEDELMLEKIWLAKKNKEISEKRTEEENQRILTIWGKSKGRINENIIRKHENTRYGSNFKVVGYVPSLSQKKDIQKLRQMSSDTDKFKKLFDEESSVDDMKNEQNDDCDEEYMRTRKNTMKSNRYEQNIIDLRDNKETFVKKKIIPNAQLVYSEMNQQRIDRIRKSYGDLINAQDDKMQNGRKTPNLITISAFGNPLIRSRSISGRIPVTHCISREKLRVQQYKEIERLKYLFASQEIEYRPKSLERAILIPQDYPTTMMTSENFVRPGSRLFINPFAPLRKKIVKKKKKKSS